MPSPADTMSVLIMSMFVVSTILLLSSTATLAFSTRIVENGTFNDKSGPLYAENSKGGAMKKAYNDDALFAFHMMTQRQKIRDYAAMDTYVNTASLWNQAWHDSFVRNGLTDFVPPLTDSLSVLVVGDRYRGPAADGGMQVVSDDDTSAAISAGSIGGDIDGSTEIDSANNNESGGLGDSSCSFLAAVFGDENNMSLNNNDGSDDSGGKRGSALGQVSYDCIMDQGVIANLCADLSNEISDSSECNLDMARLLYEATKRLRDMGIYVATTPPLSARTKECLMEMGESFGLQWEFDLDGISDENQVVSVARKHYAGELPPGWQSFRSRGLHE